MRSTQVAVFVHLVWATWDRLPLLTDENRPPIYCAIGAKCEELRVDVLAIGGVEDHVHLLVQLPATLAIAELVKHVKGASSHLANFRLSDGGSFRWQGSYAAFPVGKDAIPRVVSSITNQRRHHQSNTLDPEGELPFASEALATPHASGLPHRSR